MDSELVNQVVTSAVPLALTGAGAYFIMQRRRRIPRIPEETTSIPSDGMERHIHKDLVGMIMQVAIGTYGINKVTRDLHLQNEHGVSQITGSVLVIENDSQVVHKFRQDIPATFRNRVVYCSSAAFSGGMRNKPIHEVKQKVDLWGPPIIHGTDDIIDLHLRRSGGRAPSEVHVAISLGGQGPLGLLATERLHARFPEALFVGYVAFPEHARLRERFTVLQALYEKAGIDIWVAMDNGGADPVTCDTAMSALETVMVCSALGADRVTMPNNIYSLAATEEPGAILSLEVAPSEVVAFAIRPTPRRGPRYLVYRQPLVERITDQLHRLEEGQGIRSVRLPAGHPRTSTFDFVLVNVIPEGLRQIEDEVNEAWALWEKSQGRSHRRANFERRFISFTAQPVDPDKPTCSVMAIRLAAIENRADIIDQIIQPTEQQMLLPEGQEEHLTRFAVQSSGNNHAPQATGNTDHTTSEKPL